MKDDMLFVKCEACSGIRKTTSAMMVDGLVRADGSRYSGPLPIGSLCPCCKDGYIEVGVTESQLMRLIEERKAVV